MVPPETGAPSRNDFPPQVLTMTVYVVAPRMVLACFDIAAMSAQGWSRRLANLLVCRAAGVHSVYARRYSTWAHKYTTPTAPAVIAPSAASPFRPLRLDKARAQSAAEMAKAMTAAARSGRR